jgi:Zn-dependent metalloprotease
MKILFNIAVLSIFAIAAFCLIPNKTQAQKSVFDKGTSVEVERIKQISLEFLNSRMAERGLVGDANTFAVENVSIDDLNMAHTKVRQTVNSIPVWEGEAIVHLNNDGSLFTITDDMKRLPVINTNANLSEKEAVSLARRAYRGSKFLTEEPKSDLWIFEGKDRTHLVYRVSMKREDGSAKTSMPVYFIDAQTGETVFSYDNLQTQAVTGSGSSLYSGVVSIGTYKLGATYYMENTIRKVGTFTFNNGTTSIFRLADADNVWSTGTQRTDDDAHFGAESTMNYYQAIHGRSRFNFVNYPLFNGLQ